MLKYVSYAVISGAETSKHFPLHYNTACYNSQHIYLLTEFSHNSHKLIEKDTSEYESSGIYNVMSTNSDEMLLDSTLFFPQMSHKLLDGMMVIYALHFMLYDCGFKQILKLL
jgi:hypothetical protein